MSRLKVLDENNGKPNRGDSFYTVICCRVRQAVYTHTTYDHACREFPADITAHTPMEAF
jgi:hypothetical protein